MHMRGTHIIKLLSILSEVLGEEKRKWMCSVVEASLLSSELIVEILNYL